MRKYIEGVGCYLSCMILFNLIYGLLIISRLNISCDNLIYLDAPVLCSLTTSGILFLFGVFYSVLITKMDDTERNLATIGKTVEIVSVIDKTAESYFTNFSVIVLSSIALPVPTDWFVFAIYVLIEVTIGIVYIKKKQYFMNPLLSLLSYNIYECTLWDNVIGSELKGTTIFITKGVQITKGCSVKYKNINSEIIWLKNYE